MERFVRHLTREAGAERASLLLDAAGPEPSGAKSCAKWTGDLVLSMETGLGPDLTTAVLESCGRECQAASRVKKARTIWRESGGDLAACVERWNREHVLHDAGFDGQTFRFAYPRCFCGRVNSVSGMPKSYCDCSRGWARELFEGVFGAPADVRLVKSVQAGDDHCEFEVRVQLTQ